jgi:hypothetical protein
MGQASSIKGMPPEVRDILDRFIRSDRATQKQILEFINARLEKKGNKPISRSALSRYAIRMREAGARIRQAREIASVWVAELGEEPAGEVGRLMIELVRTMAFDAASKALEGDEPAAPKLIASLAKAVRDLEHAAKLSAEREMAIRREVAAQAAKVVKRGAKAAGLSAEAIERIERDVLGIAA